MSHRIAIFVSGTGRHLENFVRLALGGELDAHVTLVLCDRAGAGAIERAQKYGLQPVTLLPADFEDGEAFSRAAFAAAAEAGAETVLLAGFLRLLHIPADWTGRVLNIHPSLLPAFGGKGYYGHHVHEAVLERGCTVSGCTVHYVDQEYDHGRILVQRTVPVLQVDTPDDLATRIFDEELIAFPEALRLHMQALRVGQGPEDTA
ncbi:MAG: phosphoribosylglycinamide formyltransferase [Planctomycetota bacterium]|jgi:phosphoribosylglycinamide formyltransferase-1|nr:phosphoribosylglycinamide formyltransferase [Candidatus Woesearchaeota archaeon]MDP6387036.1 phosphoribosylglycinamide formyltransferase [Planctomycetota bacterium]MDP6739104.1 phosphoribosylglycinamide formyltransferase [Planctomycetota bacterium]MDP6938628.1 phosphoribosylglycinamide formyltransferase [Planctomycetota bacterium]